MNAFYCLVKVSPNPSAGDLITIGIIVADESGVLIKFSDNKLNIVQTLLGKNFIVIDFIVKQLKNKVVETNSIITNNQTLLFKKDHFFRSEYFEYLSRYSNNLIKFSKPIDYFDSVSEGNFNKLFVLFVDGKAEAHKKAMNNQETIFLDKIEKKLVGRVQNKVHTNISFDDKIIPSLYFRIEMDCIGRNGVFTGAKSLFFNKSIQTIHSQVSDYITLITELENNYNQPKDNNFYLITDEPQNNTKEHFLWTKVKALNKIKVISSDESEIVADKIEKSGAKTFLSQKVLE
jgi:hypothetical protein